MKYIDAERLKKEIKRQADLYQDTFTYDMCDKLVDFIDACMPDIVPREISAKNWKPTKEQIKALNAINCYGGLSYVGQQSQLISLYNDLKKL